MACLQMYIELPEGSIQRSKEEEASRSQLKLRKKKEKEPRHH